ncbi:MAG: ABC transporter substrate-binding protein [Candidatus Rokubacteria bacterium]|nr:ABC transporter substrate-binding protein [Candidatus Rokubacteria bacterium]
MGRIDRRLPIALLLVWLGAVTPAGAQEPIHIGSSIPITGGVAFFGQHSRWGTELAIAEANAAGGVLGRKIEVNFQDNRCNPAEAVKSVTQMLGEKKYVAMLDGLCSGVVLAIMPLIERAQIPLVVANASATAVAEKSGAGGNKWTFKVNPTDASLAEAMVAWLAKEGKIANIAFLGEDTDFGRSGMLGFQSALGRRGQKLASTDFYQQGTADFTAVFTKLRAQKPASLALYAIAADFQNLIRQYHSFGVGIPLTGRVLSDQIPKEILASGALDGTSSVQPYTPEVETAGNKAFVAAFQKMHGNPPNLLSYMSYETTRVLLDAIKRAGKADPAAIRDALEKTKLSSLLGDEIEFDKNNLAHKNAVILTIKNGQIVVLGLSRT